MKKYLQRTNLFPRLDRTPTSLAPTRLLQALVSIRRLTDFQSHNAQLLVVVSTSDNHQRLFINAVDQPVRVIYAARPKPREVLPQGLGLADALKWMAKGVLDQCIDALEGLLVLALPVRVVLPGGQGPRQP